MLLKNFGDHIRSLRESRGLSQEKFALKAGIDRTYYASVDNGKRNISRINLGKISCGFGLSLSELLDGVTNG
ncbi:MAG: helix-turn-helix domain-containing protein [Coriobacteriales bacterium]|nr:helix-turn-helix domain-containing protein [Coriobacteriales bacterium]